MSATLLLLHGWGFDATLWDGVCARLPGARALRWDRGYFGHRTQTATKRPAVAVGHSLGALLLAAWLPADIPLVAINGFDRFAGPGAVPPRVLARMRRRFVEAPAAVLAEFRTRLGAAPASPIADAAALAADLDRLAVMSAPVDGRRVRLLSGTDDPLLPAALRETSFHDAAREDVAGGGHLLPLTHPERCAAAIAELL